MPKELDDLDDPEHAGVPSAHSRPTPVPRHDSQTDPPPPTYQMLRDSTMMPAAAAVPLDDDELFEGLAVDVAAPVDPVDPIGASVVRVVLSENEREHLALSDDMHAVLAVIDGTRTVTEVCAHAALPMDRARAALDRLVQRGVVRM